jgi:hypothetical protein
MDLFIIMTSQILSDKHLSRNPLLCYRVIQTFGGSGANSKASTSKGQTYRSGCPFLAKLQSYNLLSSSVDSMVKDSCSGADMIKKY